MIEKISKEVLLQDEDSSDLNDTEKLFNLITKSEIGADRIFSGPFGNRKASGRPLTFIEDFLRGHVMPCYANTHSTGIYTGGQISQFREEARDIIKKSVNAIDDNIVFVGSGSTAAIHKLIGILNITEPPIVIISPYEHHSNLLPWKELDAEFIYASDSLESSIDLVDLENKLKKYKNDKRLKIGSFTAASNVTGAVLDTDKIAILLHKYDFLSFWDYSTAAPHVKIDMNPKDCKLESGHLAYKDAVFFSGHKFIGGPQTPGVLIAKNKLFMNKTPNHCGGGTVYYVTKKKHCYLNNNEHREEGGTPAIIESIRLGLVFQFKEALDHDTILNREHSLAKKGIDFFKKIPNLILLGNTEIERLPIFTFLIRNEETGFYLHHNFVTALLNDLFGIQSRSGCACAGPYGQYLLGISDELAEAYIQFLYKQDKNSPRNDWSSNNFEIFKPGFTRLNLAFFFDDTKVDFILNAIKFVCEHGWKFLPFYNFKIENGEFKHRYSADYDDKESLGDISYENSRFNFAQNASRPNKDHDVLSNPKNEAECLNEAFKELEKTNTKIQISDQRLSFRPHTRRLRWFLLPSEAYGIIHNIEELHNKKKLNPPFIPKTFVTNDHFSYESDYDEKKHKDNNKSKKNFDSHHSYPKFHKMAAMFKKYEVNTYLKISKLKEKFFDDVYANKKEKENYY